MPGPSPRLEESLPAPPRRFRYLRDGLFLLCLGVYLANRWVAKPWLGPRLPFLRNHLNDLICMPFWLPPLFLLYRKLRLRDHDRPPSCGEIALHLALWSALFEVVGPRLGGPFTESVSDPWDIFWYGVGALVAGIVWNQPHRKAKAA